MKTLPPALAAHYASGQMSLCTCLELTRTDGQAFRYTSLDRDLVVGGQVYSSRAGLTVTDLSTTAGLSTDNLELTVTYEDAVFVRADLLGGKWSGARFRLFEVNWQTPDDGQNLILTGRTGEVRVSAKSGYTIELRSLSQIMQQSVGIVTQPLCRYRFGVNDGISRCPVSLAANTHARTVASFAGGVITFTGAAFSADHFGEGEIRFTSGPNAGLVRLIRASDANSVTPLRPPPFEPQPGDAITLVAGCRKRFDEDCKTRWAVPLDFGGEPHLPGLAELIAVKPA